MAEAVLKIARCYTYVAPYHANAVFLKLVDSQVKQVTGYGRTLRICPQQETSSPFGWCVREMSVHAADLISKAGYPQFAKTIDQAAIATGMAEVEQAFRVPCKE